MKKHSLFFFLSAFFTLLLGTAYGFQPSNAHHDSITAETAVIDQKIANLEQGIIRLNQGSNRKADVEQLLENYQRKIQLLRNRKILLKKLENTGLLLY